MGLGLNAGFIRPSRRSKILLSALMITIIAILYCAVEINQFITNYITEDRDLKIIMWITPWGYNYDPENFPSHYIPGVIIPYDVNCGLCSKELRRYRDISISYLSNLVKTHDIIFINLFCEKYYPSYQWRGFIKNITLPPIEVIDKIKSFYESSSNIFDIYIGYSEMSMCVNSDECLINLIQVYKKLREILPNVKLYYYGTSNEDPNRLIKLYEQAGLDLVGIDAWDLVLTSNHDVVIAKSTLDKLNYLATRIGWKNIILGEIGLRVDDEEAYIEPWKWKREIKYNPNITSIYYDTIMNNLLANDIRPLYIGLWAWNDGVFSIDSRKDILGIFDKYLDRK